ncbi:hypothetical protein [Candidatus Magnetaquicoccus inordinatus]|uniref:hypothetical protein n=1 Tax=Candidatus Magnetaquicoccus inordinatus TaxID=2496818 RepID=UPI00102CEC29|nr:hypothetical protein [Candidatus Magnetaquicoccus inordinatus]
MSFLQNYILFPVKAGGAILASFASIASFVFIGIADDVHTLIRILVSIVVFLLVMLVTTIYRQYNDNEKLPIDLSVIDVERSLSQDITDYGDLLITISR